MSEPIWGEVSVGTQFELAAMETLSAWMPVRVKALEQQLGRTVGEIPAPRKYTTRNNFESFPDDILPLCVVVSPGIVDQPTKEGDGTYSAWWALGVGFAAAARDVEAAAFLAKTYGAAARSILLWKQSLGTDGLVAKVEWVDESYDDLVTEDDRSVRACYNVYRVLGYNVVTEYAGPGSGVAPADPAAQPGSTWPTANIVKIDDIKVT